jgi:hypothetical protein
MEIKEVKMVKTVLMEKTSIRIVKKKQQQNNFKHFQFGT